MPENNGLKNLFLDTEEEYIREFCNVYKEEIQTPDGFVIFCKYLEKTAKHFCRGKDGKEFQKTRAQRILWAKFIFLNPDERIVLTDNSTGNMLFFLTREQHPHVVVCNKLDGKWNLISAFAVGGQRARKYKKGEEPYVFYKS